MNFNLQQPWLTVGQTEEYFTRKLIKSFTDKVQQNGWLDPLLHRAEQRAVYLKMVEVVEIIREIREESLTVRRNAYNELLFNLHSENFSYSDTSGQIDRFMIARDLKRFPSLRV